MVTTELYLFLSGGYPPPIRVHERGPPVVGEEAGMYFDLSTIIQSPFYFGNSTQHATADGTKP